MQHYTVYEYAYNGRVLGYVKSEDSVVEAGCDHLMHVSLSCISVEGSAARDLDDADTVMNKLTYMTDISFCIWRLSGRQTADL